MGPFRWNERAKRYIDRRGRFVGADTVRGALESAIGSARAEIDSLSTRLVSGSISIADWQLQMARQIKAAHLASAALARGGWGQMTQSDFGFTGARLRFQYERLRQFAADIESGKQKLNGTLLRRARMYGEAARSTAEDMTRRVEAQGGKTEERRVLSTAEHCPDCLEYAGRGWQPIGSLPRIGESVCLTSCQCHFEFR